MTEATETVERRALKAARKHYHLAINALGRSYRAGPHTATSTKHRADYERHVGLADDAIADALSRPNVDEPSDELIDRIMQAVCDPGRFVGFKGEDRTLNKWQRDALRLALNGSEQVG